MSKSVSRAEAEDVLSSVLRLVRENNKPKSRGQDPSEKLVLTPQLRVPEGGDLPLTSKPQADRPQDGDPASQRLCLAEYREENPAAKADQSAPAGDLAGLSAKINALETTIARTAGQWEPDGTSQEAYAGTTPPAIDWRGNPDLDATGQPVPAETEDDKDAALRRLVAEVVRAELRGDLGKLMTRNVRKLVLEEIQRALVAQPRD